MTLAVQSVCSAPGVYVLAVSWTVHVHNGAPDRAEYLKRCW